MADEDSTDREDITDAEIEAADAIAADIAGRPVTPLDPERVELIRAMRDAELAELLAERWFAEQERIEQQRQDEAAERNRVRERQRKETERRKAVSATEAAATASQRAADNSAALRNRIAQHDREQRALVHLQQWQRVADGFGALIPKEPEVETIEYPNTIHPGFAAKRFKFDWQE
jgi:hypothetical protein